MKAASQPPHSKGPAAPTRAGEKTEKAEENERAVGDSGGYLTFMIVHSPASVAPLGLAIHVALPTRGLRRLATDLRPYRGEERARCASWSGRAVEQVSRREEEPRKTREGTKRILNRREEGGTCALIAVVSVPHPPMSVSVSRAE